MIDLIFAHPYPHRSRSNRALLEAVRDVPELEVRSLYDLYPDFAIDIEAEQAALLRAEIVVWQHPFYWYSVPPLLKLWFDKVLAHGWAYGEGQRALQNKVCQWVTTTGGDPSAYRPGALHGFSFDHFVPALEQTARFCGMRWQPPLVVHGARKISDDALRELANTFRLRLEALARGELSAEDAHG
ncbi:MAG TPA: glutathione-regulated potassium-efflux system oxidoreductase KefF [Polyangiales bacterium]|nr:glutathione-regulated potassium-efflux system oxidoreductase KefF [Polyangiales bacterium]